VDLVVRSEEEVDVAEVPTGVDPITEDLETEAVNIVDLAVTKVNEDPDSMARGDHQAGQEMDGVQATAQATAQEDQTGGTDLVGLTAMVPEDLPVGMVQDTIKDTALITALVGVPVGFLSPSKLALPPFPSRCMTTVTTTTTTTTTTTITMTIMTTIIITMMSMMITESRTSATDRPAQLQQLQLRLQRPRLQLRLLKLKQFQLQLLKLKQLQWWRQRLEFERENHQHSLEIVFVGKKRANGSKVVNIFSAF